MGDTAFDRQAAGYDVVAESRLGVELRGRVHAVLEPLLAPTDTVVDLGCGSGIDAEWLAHRVKSVIAVDSSAEMASLTRKRCAGLSNVTVFEADVAELELPEPVDVVLANFGVVNCVGDLVPFRMRLQKVLNRGGKAVVVTMARWCPIELAVGVLTLNTELLRRRRAGTRPDASYDGLEVRYASAASLAKAWESDFALTHTESLGLVLPPYEQRAWLQNRPRPTRVLANIDRRLGPLGARFGWGDHHLCVFERAS